MAGLLANTTNQTNALGLQQVFTSLPQEKLVYNALSGDNTSKYAHYERATMGWGTLSALSAFAITTQAVGNGVPRDIWLQTGTTNRIVLSSASVAIGGNITTTGAINTSAVNTSGDINATGNITAAGSIGVGTTLPGYPLSVTGTISGFNFRSTQGIPNNADASTVGYSFGQDGDTGLFSPIVGGGAANGVVSVFANNTEVMRATSPSNVGTVNIGGNASGGGSLTVVGTISSTGTLYASAATITGTISSASPIISPNSFNTSATLSGNLVGINRASGTTYTNKTGRILVVYVYGSNAPNNGNVTIAINGTTVMQINGYGSGWGGTFIVPSGATYLLTVNNVTLTSWYEF